MAMTADSASNHHSPRGSSHSSGAGDGQSSPQLRRKNLPSPWAQVVRGGEPESVSSQRSPSSSPPPSVPPTSVPEPAVAESSSPSKAASTSPPPPMDNSSSVVATAAADTSDASNSNAARPKKPAWNKPSNGVVEVGPVMGAVSWPALSESTKQSPKPLSSSSSSLAEASPSSSKTVSEGSSVPNNQVPVISNVPQKQTTSTGNANTSSSSNPNRPMSGRPKSKRGGNGGGGGMNNAAAGPGQGGFNRPTPATQPATPPQPPPFPLFSVPPTFGSIMPPPLADPSAREPMYRGNNWETRPVGGFVSQSHPSNEHRNNSRRGNYGPRGGDSGSYHNNFGSRRDQDRGNYGNSRDVHVQSPRGPPRGFVRPPPPNATTFVPPQPMRTYPNPPMGFPEFIYIPQMPMEPFRGIPGVPYIPPPGPPPPSVFVPTSEPALAAMLVNQIDYYFSDANLVKDEFLKSNMDDQGWVPISLIAGFPRVKNLTTNVQLILDSLRASTVVEVQDEKVRRRIEWIKWVPAASRAASDSGLPSPGSDLLTTSIQKISMDEGTFDKGTKANPHPENSPISTSAQQQLPNGEVDDKHTNKN